MVMDKTVGDNKLRLLVNKKRRGNFNNQNNLTIQCFTLFAILKKIENFYSIFMFISTINYN